MEEPEPEMEEGKPSQQQIMTLDEIIKNENQIENFSDEKKERELKEFWSKHKPGDAFEKKPIKGYRTSKIYRGASYVIREPAYLIKDVLDAVSMPVIMGIGALEALTFTSLTIAYGSAGWGAWAYSLYAVPFASYIIPAWLHERNRKNLGGGQWDDKKFHPERYEQNFAGAFLHNYKKETLASKFKNFFH